MSNASTTAAATPITIKIHASLEVGEAGFGTVVVVEEDVAGTVVVGCEVGVVRVVGGLVELVVVVGGLVVLVVVGALVVVEGSEAAPATARGPMTTRPANSSATSAGRRRGGGRVGKEHVDWVRCLDAPVIVSPRLSEPKCSAAMLTGAGRATRVLECPLECERVGPVGPTLSRNPPGCSFGPRAGGGNPLYRPFCGTEVIGTSDSMLDPVGCP